jgi:hypothetical protein
MDITTFVTKFSYNGKKFDKVVLIGAECVKYIGKVLKGRSIMSLNVAPVKAVSAAASIVSKKAPAKMPYVLDESIPRPTNPTKQIAVSIFEKFVEKIKNKPDSERNVIDYAVLLFDKLRKLNPKMYVAS